MGKYKRFYKRLALLCSLLLAIEVGCIFPNAAKEEDTEELPLTSVSAVLIEPISGTILYEKDKDKQLPPASVTKVMTLLLIMEAIEDGKITLDEKVTVSAHAASMGGSQVFLEEGETQTVDDMIKCIAVSSANDACVAMAERIAGSEETFVDRMKGKTAWNEKYPLCKLLWTGC